MIDTKPRGKAKRSKEGKGFEMANSTFMKFQEVGEMLAKMVLEGDKIPWKQPWAEGLLGWRSIGGYRLSGAFNNLIYMMAAMEHGSRWFGNFKQVKFSKGTHPRRGSQMITVLSPIFKKIEEKDPITGEVKEDSRLIGFTTRKLWNMGQIEGFDASKFEKDTSQIEFTPVEEIDAAVARYAEATGLEIVDGGMQRACYFPMDHKINMPIKESFESVEAYYETLFHELCHATKGGKDGIKRDLSYAAEELVAEFGSSMLCGFFGIQINAEQDAAYIRTWKDRIANDPDCLTKGVSGAVKAAKQFLEFAGVDLPEKEEYTPAERAKIPNPSGVEHPHPDEILAPRG